MQSRNSQMNIADLTVRQSKSSHPWPISWHLYIQFSLQHLPHSRPSRVFREQRISPLIIHCFRWTQWIPIPSYCWAPSSRLIAAPKVINFIPGDVPTNVNDRRRLLTPRLCFNLLAGPSEPLPARWGAEENYTARSFRLLFALLLRSVKNMNYGFRPSIKETFTRCIHDGPVPRKVPWQQRILKLLPEIAVQ